MNNDLTFAIRADLAVVGNNPEMADFDNRRGDLVGEVHYVCGEATDGRRFAHSVRVFTINGYTINGNPERDPEDECYDTFFVNSNGMTVERLERLVAHLNANHPALNPNHWEEIQACYGSEAYQRDGWEDVAIAIERDEDRYAA